MVELSSLVMLREDGKNHAEWHHNLADYFQSEFALVGSFLLDLGLFHPRRSIFFSFPDPEQLHRGKEE